MPERFPYADLSQCGPHPPTYYVAVICNQNPEESHSTDTELASFVHSSREFVINKALYFANLWGQKRNKTYRVLVATLTHEVKNKAAYTEVKL